MRLVILLLFLLFPIGSYGWYFVKISNGMAFRKYFYKPNPSVNWLVIHDNENDASLVMQWALKEYGGHGFDIVNLNNPNRRIIKEYYKNTFFYYDPNRIFTDSGILKTLERYNRHYSKIKKIGFYYIKNVVQKEFLRKIPLNNNSYLIVLHNNYRRGAVTLKNYYLDKRFFAHWNIAEEMRNFALVPHKKIFDALIELNTNAIWQYDIEKEDNDGSLLEYSVLNKKLYINVESEFGNIEAQKRIIRNIMQMIEKQKIENKIETSKKL